MANRPVAIIADAGKTFLMYFSTLLNRLNYEVMPVGSGEEVFDLARIVTPRLLAFNVDLPGADGVTTLRRIRDDMLLARTPVIMFAQDRQQAGVCAEIGCCAFLTKPINLQHLHDALQVCQPQQEKRRRHLRTPFNKTVLFAVGGRFERGFAVTLSEGGLFIRSESPHPVGTELEIDIPLGSKESMLVQGRVIYIMGMEKGRFTLPPGMAVAFASCTPQMQERLREEVVNLLSGDILGEQQEEHFVCG